MPSSAARQRPDFVSEFRYGGMVQACDYARLTRAEARAVIDLAAAELPTLASHSEGSERVAATLERLVDTTTACAVHVDDTGRLPRRHAERLDALLAELTSVA